jgi:hypothetical protein
MKPFSMLKLPVILLGLGVAMVLAPPCKAQSEIAPDHFDGSDNWSASQASSQKATPAKGKQTQAASQVKSHQTGSPATLRLASKRDSSAVGQPAGAAIQDKRKATARKPKQP